MNRIPFILIAEDDFEDRFIMAETFNELGYKNAIYILDDGIQMLEYLAKNGPGEIKLIILDLNMPKLNGTEVLKRLQADSRFASIAVIIFSTSVNEIEMENCLQLGAKSYITKPSKYADYLDTCRKFYEFSVAV